MRKLLLSVTFILAIAAILISSCRKNPTEYIQQNGAINLPSTPYEYFNNGGGQMNALATLGRVFFYDKHLSKNNAISCASCHIQEHAFGDNKALSQGFENKRTSRNSIAIHNIQDNSFLGISTGFEAQLFWDNRTSGLRTMLLEPALNHIEMGMASRDEIIEKVNKLDYYKPLLKNAGINELTEYEISRALSFFVTSINVVDTKFDRAKMTVGGNPPTEKFTALEEYGESIFNGKYNCNSCHRIPLSGYSSNGQLVNIGLPNINGDKGRMEVTGNEWDIGMFKVPGLRNVQFSAPYMHDGRFKTLEDVLEHYSHGIQNAPNLDWRLQDNQGAKQMNITDYDKKALIAFLHTLTDYDVLTHDRFSNPFVN